MNHLLNICNINGAERCVCADREQDYGDAEDNFAMIARLWSDYLGSDVEPQDVPIMMILLKIARISTGHGKNDNWVDIAGYAACGGEIASNDKRDT